MNERPIDRSKKSNIYCAHCEHYRKFERQYGMAFGLTGEPKRYWNRCEQFEWKKAAMYLDEML